MSHYLDGEWFKARKSMSCKVCLIILLAFSILSVVSFIVTSQMYKSEEKQEQLRATYITQGMPEDEIDDYVELVVHPTAISIISDCIGGSNFFMLFGVFACIFIASDYNNGTVRQIASKGLSRTRIYAGKVGIVAFVGLIYTVLAFLLYFGGMGAVFQFGDGPDNMAVYVLKVIGTLILVLLAYTAVISFFAILTKSLGGSIASVIILPIVVSIVLSLIETVLDHKYDIQSYWITSSPAEMLDVSIKTSQYLKYGGVLFGVAVVFYALGYVVFKNQEL